MRGGFGREGAAVAHQTLAWLTLVPDWVSHAVWHNHASSTLACYGASQTAVRTGIVHAVLASEQVEARAAVRERNKTADCSETNLQRSDEPAAHRRGRQSGSRGRSARSARKRRRRAPAPPPRSAATPPSAPPCRCPAGWGSRGRPAIPRSPRSARAAPCARALRRARCQLRPHGARASGTTRCGERGAGRAPA